MARRQDQHDSPPVPNGWFAVEWSRDLREGDVRPIHYCGEDLVLFRTREGHARVLDAFCPHLGAHLGHGGRVMGETLRCPFHAWQFDGATGACSQIPYCERIPQAARLRSWDVVERNGMVFVWYHAEGKPPEWDFPVMPEIGHPDWSEPKTLEVAMDVHLQDAHENNNDPMHFQFVHGVTDTPPTEIRYTPGTTHYRIVHEQETSSVLGTFQVTLTRDSWGLGLSSVRMGSATDPGLLLYSSSTPIDETRTVSRWLITARKSIVDYAGEEFIRGLTEGVQQDVPIWRNKVHRANPVLCEADTFLADYRRWARQFYCDTDPLPGVGEESGR